MHEDQKDQTQPQIGAISTRTKVVLSVAATAITAGLAYLFSRQNESFGEPLSGEDLPA